MKRPLNGSLLESLAIALALSSGSPAIAQVPATAPLKQNDASSVLLQRRGTLERGDTMLRSDGSLYDEYTFAGQAGQQINIVLESAAFDAYLMLLDPSGRKIAENDDSQGTNAALMLTLPHSGTYTVIANSYNNTGRGEYTLTVISPDRTISDNRHDQPPLTASRPAECNGQQILTASACAGDGLDAEEQRLYTLINEYRAQNGLPSIPLSPSLSLVANRHVLDLDQNIGSLTHGWSDCPYNAGDRSTYACMWNAPQRLGTPYPGNGYENAHGGSGSYRATAESALRSWTGSGPHNAVILNQGIWQDREWQALGIGIYGGYAVLWVGEEPDPAASR